MIAINSLRVALFGISNNASPIVENQGSKRQRWSFARSTAEGMTIVELMIVVFIGALIMAGAFGALRYVDYVKKQNTNRQLSTLDNAIETYALELGVYPHDLQELISGPTDPKLQRRWDGNAYVELSELADAWGREFVYELNPSGSDRKYELYSLTKTGEGTQRSPATK